MECRPFNPATTRSSVLEAIRDPANRPAWERFFDQYAGYIYALALRRGLREADAEDIVQTVLVEVAGKMQTFRYDRARGRFHVWLARAAGYRIDDLLRRNARRAAREVLSPPAPGSGAVPAPALAAEAPDEFAALFEEEWLDLLRRRALERLRAAVSLRQFELFHAAVVEEWPTEKVMRTFGASRAAVYQAKHRLAPLWRDALRAVRDELDAPPDIPPAPGAAANSGNAP